MLASDTDAVGGLAFLAWGQVTKEPIICVSSLADPSGVTLIVDLWACGVWQPQIDVLFDVCVLLTLMLFPIMVVRHRLCKKYKNVEAYLARHADFILCVFQ